MIKCPLCSHNSSQKIYESGPMPIFQNKVYRNLRTASKAKKGCVSLYLCKNCSFVFNYKFNSKIMNYDKSYHNEQEFSEYFKKYLNDIVKLLLKKGFQNKKIVEIGCGKGYFLENLARNGFEIMGFDPAYEGTNENIIKEYFGPKYFNLKADLIILRHTLEHINDPFRFLKKIAKANHWQGKIFIEVPSLEWIKNRGAFWDIFYEHCNYFTKQSLRAMFSRSNTGKLFNAQYLYLLANLKDLKKNVEKTKKSNKLLNLKKLFQVHLLNCENFIRQNKNLAIWGAGAKGMTFLNILDRNKKYISYVIDINPLKKDKYIGGTGHKIVSPDFVKNDYSVKTVLVMNSNYESEIKKYLVGQGKIILNIEEDIYE